MNKIRVDFNSLGRTGMIRSSVRRAETTPVVGDRVLAVDPVENMEYEALVHGVDEATGTVWLAIDWEDAPNQVRLAGPGTWASNGRLVVTASPVPIYGTTTSPFGGFDPELVTGGTYGTNGKCL